jgi:hypothetical protein
MTLKRSSSAKKGNLKKKPKLNTEETNDYTKSQTHDLEMIGSGDEQEFAQKPDKLKTAKKSNDLKLSKLTELNENSFNKTRKNIKLAEKLENNKGVKKPKSILRKKPKLDNTEEATDYTKSLTDDLEMIGSDDELELVHKPDKIKMAQKSNDLKLSKLNENINRGKMKLVEKPEKNVGTKKAKSLQNKSLSTDSENNLLKKTKGKSNSTNGIFQYSFYKFKFLIFIVFF